MKTRKEHKKKKQPEHYGLLGHLGHRRAKSGVRWLRVWAKRQHESEMAEALRNWYGS